MWTVKEKYSKMSTREKQKKLNMIDNNNDMEASEPKWVNLNDI